MTAANGKSTATLVIQIASIIIVIVAGVATPLILMYAHMVAVDERLSEIETQFKSMDQLHNVNLAQQMRTNALLWRKCYGEEFPAQVYFPEVTRSSK